MSIIIAAHNEEANLRKLLPALLNLDYPNFEIVIALDRCSDSSQAFIDQLTSTNIKTIVINEVPEVWNPKKFALKSAISEAKGSWLVFTDADCIPLSDQWLNIISDHVAAKIDILIGISPYRSYGSFLTHLIRFESFMTAFYYAAMTLLGKPYMAVGRNFALRKSFFMQTDGYYKIKSVNGGDDDLFIQANANGINTRMFLGSESLVETRPETSWKAYFNQKLRHLSVGTRYKAIDVAFISVIHTTHFLFVLLSLFVASQSFFLPVLLFYLFIKLVGYRFAAGKMGININYILFPLVDMLYAVLIPAMALWSKLEKDIKWKN